MSQPGHTVVGIDVGDARKGFHAVVLRGNGFERVSDSDPAAIVAWCLVQKAAVVAVDAPCAWSRTGSSRQAERDLKLFCGKLHCFATPKREIAVKHNKGFYGWVFNGEKLYQQLREYYQLYDGERCKGPLCIETFPHAVACALAGKAVPAKHKASVRRNVLRDRGYDVSNLPNIDYVDAALCAIAADEFRRNNFQSFGNREEGFIIVPG
jgi:predicted nuclease with RNAse H fold